MRRSVAQRGTAGSTFEHVAREAGVSRGLLHYYFGTKEQLLAEAVRRDCELRLELLERQLAGAQTADDFIGLMAQHLQETVREDPDFITLVFELFTLSRRNEDIAVEYADLMRRIREQVAGMLAVAQSEGVLQLHAEPEAVAEILFSLGDGFALRMLTEPERDFDRDDRAGIAARGRCWRTDSAFTPVFYAAWHSYNQSANADLRVPPPGREHLRGSAVLLRRAADEGPRDGRAGAARAARARRALQGQGLLQHRLRHAQTPARDAAAAAESSSASASVGLAARRTPLGGSTRAPRPTTRAPTRRASQDRREGLAGPRKKPEPVRPRADARSPRHEPRHVRAARRF